MEHNMRNDKDNSNRVLDSIRGLVVFEGKSIPERIQDFAKKYHTDTERLLEKDK